MTRRKQPTDCPECRLGDWWHSPDGTEVRICLRHAQEIGLFRRHDGHWQVRAGWSRVQSQAPLDNGNLLL